MPSQAVAVVPPEVTAFKLRALAVVRDAPIATPHVVVEALYTDRYLDWSRRACQMKGLRVLEDLRALGLVRRQSRDVYLLTRKGRDVLEAVAR